MKSLITFTLLYIATIWLQAQEVQPYLHDGLGHTIYKHGQLGYVYGNREGVNEKEENHESGHVKAAVVIELVDARSGQLIDGRTMITEASTGKNIPFLKEGDRIIFVGIHGRKYRIQAESEGYKKIEVLFSASINRKITVLMTSIWKYNNEQAFLLR